MEDSPVLDFSIQSFKGSYTVEFKNLTPTEIAELGTHFIVDKNVADRAGLLPNSVVIEATEEAKSYQGIIPVIEQLVKLNLKRDSVLVAIGGGITQDIACFIANNYMRGIKWKFIPTTLLAQADSCIGSKSSINFGDVKNLLGSFTPPNQVIIGDHWLETLDPKDIKSGIGEILKLFIIDNRDCDYEHIKNNLNDSLYQALQIKKVFIEEDEFDQARRQILNYGHCFGHPIESVTNFAIPHGIAVSYGMDVANYIALHLDLISQEQFDQWHELLLGNYIDYADVYIDDNRVLSLLTKDKKNTTSKINIIIPDGQSIVKHSFDPSDEFWTTCKLALHAIKSLALRRT